MGKEYLSICDPVGDIEVLHRGLDVVRMGTSAQSAVTRISLPPEKETGMVSEYERDMFWMKRCIELSNGVLRDKDSQDEEPFSCVLVQDALGIAIEQRNEKSTGFTHAESGALGRARKFHDPHYGRGTPMTGWTLYSIVEPCVSCTHQILEHQISRVVYALPSPHMGGFTKFSLHTDKDFLRSALSGSDADSYQVAVSAGVAFADAWKIFRNLPDFQTMFKGADQYVGDKQS